MVLNCGILACAFCFLVSYQSFGGTCYLSLRGWGEGRLLMWLFLYAAPYTFFETDRQKFLQRPSSLRSRLHASESRKTGVFLLAAVITWNLTQDVDGLLGRSWGYRRVRWKIRPGSKNSTCERYGELPVCEQLWNSSTHRLSGAKFSHTACILNCALAFASLRVWQVCRSES